MRHADSLTLQRLLSLVEGHLRRCLPGRIAVPSRAYAAAPTGTVSVIDFPVPGSGEDVGATAAILAHEMARRGCRLFVLVQQDESERVHLTACCLGRHPARVGRVLQVERAGRKIESVRRLQRRGDIQHSRRFLV